VYIVKWGVLAQGSPGKLTGCGCTWHNILFHFQSFWSW